MEKVAARYPQDVEARYLYALVLNITAQPTDKTFANQLKAAAILEPCSGSTRPPGGPHYLIHTYDYASLPKVSVPGFDAGRPSSARPCNAASSTSSRVGQWPEMVEGNRASYLAAKSELTETTLGIGTYDALHAMDYMIFGHLQQLQDKAARESPR